ncbi:MAG: hypothetical protein EOP55_25155 [Sphingobacteriales bacterium]|nr:MAG: hypothetical protein EOP55_25155 [Sphingobacteriales bacterium]
MCKPRLIFCHFQLPVNSELGPINQPGNYQNQLHQQSLKILDTHYSRVWKSGFFVLR